MNMNVEWTCKHCGAKGRLRAPKCTADHLASLCIDAHLAEDPHCRMQMQDPNSKLLGCDIEITMLDEGNMFLPEMN